MPYRDSVGITGDRNRTTRISETSLEAYHSLDHEKIDNLHAKILEGLKLIGKGTSEQISDAIGIPYTQVWKRMSELERDEKIYNTKIKHKNRSGRNAFQYALRGVDTKLPETEKALEGKSVGDYAKNILVQKDLFGGGAV